jgi:hypothetical protein
MKLRKNDRGNFELTEKFVLNFWRIFDFPVISAGILKVFA